MCFSNKVELKIIFSDEEDCRKCTQCDNAYIWPGMVPDPVWGRLIILTTNIDFPFCNCNRKNKLSLVDRKSIFLQYMGTQQTPFVRRLVRKLLLYICGSKDKYRQLRDMHTLDTHMSEVKTLCGRAGLDENGVPIILPYDSLISFVSRFFELFRFVGHLLLV